MHEPRLLALGDRPVRLLLAIHLANILALVGMNTLTLPGTFLPAVYLAALGAAWGLIGRLGLGRPAPTQLELGRWDRQWVDVGFATYFFWQGLFHLPWCSQIMDCIQLSCQNLLPALPKAEGHKPGMSQVRPGYVAERRSTDTCRHRSPCGSSMRKL